MRRHTMLSVVNNTYSRCLLFVIALLIMVLAIPGHASAVSGEVPDRNDFTAGTDIFLVVSRSGAGNGLEAPQSIVWFYFDSPVGNQITIFSGQDNGTGACGIPGTGSGHDGSPFLETNTSFTFTDMGSGAVLGSRTDDDMNCGNYAINFVPLSPYQLPGTTGPAGIKYVVRMVVSNSTVGTINAFKARITGGAGGIASISNENTSQFAIQDRANWSPSPGSDSDYRLPFGSDCTVDSRRVVRFEWFDDDWANGNQSGNMRFALYNTTTGTRIGPIVDGATAPGTTWADSGETSGFTGNNDPGYFQFAAYPNQNYLVHWVGVTERNGIQFRMPFDSFYYTYDCPEDDPYCSLFGADDNPLVAGNTTTLRWNTVNAISGTIDQGIGNMIPINNGSVTISPLFDTTYTATLTDADGDTSTCTTIVQVVGPPPPPLSCPLYEPSDYRFVRVDLPDNSPGTTGPPGGFYSGDYLETERLGETRVDGVTDMSSGSNPAGIGPSLNGIEGGTAYQVTYLDYTIYVDTYPYDPNFAQVAYSSKYRYKWWTRGSEAVPGVDANGDGDFNDVGDTPPQYNWSEGAWVDQWHSEAPVNAETIRCFDREFEITPEFGTANWDPDNEDVQSVSFNIRFNTDYKTKSPPGNKYLRNPNRVLNVPVSVFVSLYHYDYTGPGDNDNYSPLYGTYFNCGLGATFNTTPSSNDINSAWNGAPDVTDSLNHCMTANLPPLTAGDFACATVTLTDFYAGDMDHNGTFNDTNGTPFVLNHGAAPGAVGCTDRIINKPFFTVSGGDALAGMCGDMDAGAYAWNHAGTFRGAGTTLAVYATAVIDSMSSRGNVLPGGIPDYISFGNQTGTYGGFWGGDNPPTDLDYTSCAPVYADLANDIDGNFTSGNSLNAYLPPLGSADILLEATGDVVIDGGNIAADQKIAIVVDGNVQITNPIRNIAGGYSNFEEIPSVIIIADNIFIHPSVQEVYATLIAQDGAGTGTVYTCSGNVNFTPPGFAEIADQLAPNNCFTGLVINGSVVADQIMFHRSQGSLRSGNPSMDYTTVFPALPSFTVAERFLYSPMHWLSTTPLSSSNRAPYESFTALPPIL